MDDATKVKAIAPILKAIISALSLFIFSAVLISHKYESESF